MGFKNISTIYKRFNIISKQKMNSTVFATKWSIKILLPVPHSKLSIIIKKSLKMGEKMQISLQWLALAIKFVCIVCIYS